ncbi:hypothetical protein ACQKQD_18205 [Methylobacterium sp. NPDC080182]|uniref:hypothetical protein n=1 Tax=Methylobacterium sp. NPDC080182 TaxID=3390590 RepID=UPI003D02B321
MMITLETDDEDPRPDQWHVRLHSRLPGAMIGRNFNRLADALDCALMNPGSRLLRHVEGDSWARLSYEGAYYVPCSEDTQDTHRKFMGPLADWARSLDGAPVSTEKLAELVRICAGVADPA